ncbi:MAG: 3'(2'),5'-bisphosphate nucleotidase CysQ, partial [Terriglobia bacterium]
LKRIHEALEAAGRALQPFVPGAVKADYKSAGDPVTEADRAVNHVLHETLLRDGEGWLSEESADDQVRLGKDRVWIVDPLDGTREFVSGIPEWCVSIAFVESGRATAAGIKNPATGETFLGSLGSGVVFNGKAVHASPRHSLPGALVLASRSEVKRGEWKRFDGSSFSIQPMGSVAYKLARVAAGLADATWTLTPKHEWDVAAGVLLVEAAGGFVSTLTDGQPSFNNESALMPGLIAGGRGLRDDISSFLRPHLQARTMSASPDRS